MKDFKNSLFAGALGKTNNPGGSKFMTIPLTRDISGSAYEIDYEITGEFFCCTLNGLLWLYQIENSFNIIALKWNEETNKIEFAENKIIPKESVRARGIDWILLQHSFILISDNQIKIFSLFDTSEEKFFYSVLRSYQRWGNTDGYFSTNYEGLYPAGTHQMEHCYSVLPAVGDYQIIEDFLICRNSGEKRLYPLIPLEFNYEAEPTYGTGYNAENRGFQLAMINSELWGRGTKNIGKVSILPAVFDENGEPKEFYLYISPEYRQQSLSSELAITGSEKPIGFLSEKSSPVINGTCVNSTSEEIFDVENKEWVSPRPDDNKQTTFDIATGQGISIGEEGISFIKGNSYECRNLPQWIVPTGQFESISNEKIISSCDNAVIRTNVDTGFNRDFINERSIFYLYSNTFINDKKNKFHVTQLVEKKDLVNISWNDIYKTAPKIQSLEEFTAKTIDNYLLNFDPYPIFLTKTGGGDTKFQGFLYFINSLGNHFEKKTFLFNHSSLASFISEAQGQESGYVSRFISNTISGLGEDYTNFNTSVFQTILISSDISYNIYRNNNKICADINFSVVLFTPVDISYDYIPFLPYVEKGLIEQGHFHAGSNRKDNTNYYSKTETVTLFTIPDYVMEWSTENPLYLENPHLFDKIDKNNYLNFFLTEKNTKTIFSIHNSKLTNKDVQTSIYGNLNDERNLFLMKEMNNPINCFLFSIIVASSIFDFQSEYERSK